MSIGIILLIFLQHSVHCQTNSRSYDTNDWIPIAQHTVPQNGNNFAGHPGKQLKSSESNRQYQTIQQPAKEHRVNGKDSEFVMISILMMVLLGAHQIRLSSQLPEAQRPVAQGLPFVHQHTPFLSQANYEEVKKNQHVKQESIPSQNISPPPRQEPQREEVQLLYVPLETLRQREHRQHYHQDHSAAPSQIRFVDQNVSPHAHKQVQLQNIEQDFLQQALQAQKLQEQFQTSYIPQQHFQVPLHHIPQQHPTYQELPQFQLPPQPPVNYQPITEPPPKPVTSTASPVKKRKPHQPPLAVYMGTKDHTENEISVSDVLDILKQAKTITVQDYVSDDSPKVFVGPSNLQSPEGYVKFDLPYLSSLDKHKREGLDKLPFFVAPLNYKTPPGYSKIPFPSPHVGSVVINQRNAGEKAQSSTQNLLTLTDKNNQLLYNEGTTVASHNKNRQAFSTLFPVTSTITPEIPYGPIPVKGQGFSTPRPVTSTLEPTVSQTSQRAYAEPQVVSISSNAYPEFAKGHRFTTALPPTTEVYLAPTPYIATTNRNPTRTSHVHQRPQITPEYYETTRAPSRYVPEVTTAKYVEPQPEEEYVTRHRFNPNYQKNQDTYVQNTPAKLGFEAHITRGNFSIHDQQSDQEYRPSYQNVNVPNQYETKTERQRFEEKPKVVTESTYVSNNPQYIQQYIPEIQYELPVRGGESHEVKTQRPHHRQPVQEQQYVQLSSTVAPQNVYQEVPAQQDHRFVFNQPKHAEQHVTTEPVRVQQYVTPNPPQRNPQHHYKLPADLPISPQLPSLVNSLEDQAIRPLLAPLLLPTAEEAPEYSPEKVSTVVEPLTVPTPEPIIESTTQAKRTRTRHRGTRPPTSTTRARTSSSAQRSRRPYLDSTRQEESTTRTAASQKTRYTSRERPQVTEQIRETTPIYTQKRFRTRGRPVKTEEEYHTDKTVTNTERVVEVSPENQFTSQALQANVHVETSVEENEKKHPNGLQSDQPLTYLINGQHLIQGIQDQEENNAQIFIVRPEAPVSEEVQTEKIEEPIREKVQPQLQPQPQPIDQSQYLVETTKPRGRTRARTKSRVHPHSTTVPPAPKEEEESQEFYGFFRQPVFKPLKMEYKPSSDIRSTNVPVQHTTFAPQYSEEPVYYVADTRSSTPRVYQEPNYDEGKKQYLHSRASTPDSYEDVKPVTIRTTPARRKYTTPIQSEETTPTSEKYYTRSRKRPEEPTQRTTKIRGRVRKPTTPIPSSSEETYRAPQKDTRYRSRGKTHFKPREEESDEESENYPASFLKSQEQTERRVSTPRSVFKLTIEPEESGEVQDTAYTTHRGRGKSREVVKGEESQRYEKTVEGPNQVLESNDKKLEELKEAIPVPDQTESTENVSNESSEDKSEEFKTTTEEVTGETAKEEVVEETTPVVSTTTTEAVEKVTKKKGRRGHWKLVSSRPVDMFQSAESQNVGTVLANNIFGDEKSQKIDKEKVVQMLLENPLQQTENEKNESGESKIEDVVNFTTDGTLTTLPDEVDDGQEKESEMDYDEKSSTLLDKMEKETETKPVSLFDQLMSNIENLAEKKEEPELSEPKIIGTSTTTEISHETEICYKGRCVKSLV